MTIERVSTYIEYRDAASADPEGTPQIRQEYLLHDWYSVMKVCDITAFGTLNGKADDLVNVNF